MKKKKGATKAKVITIINNQIKRRAEIVPSSRRDFK